MEASKTLSKEDMRKQVEEWRNARRQKLVSRLTRNSKNPGKIVLPEAIVGVRVQKQLQVAGEDKSNEKADSILPSNADSSSKVEVKPQLKKNLSFRHTATSLRRATMANPKSLISSTKEIVKNEIATLNKKIACPVKDLKVKAKLTVPRSPSFTHRPQKKIAEKVKAVEVKVEKKPVTQIARNTKSLAPSATPKPVTPAVVSQKSSAWTVGFKENKKSPSMKYTPKLKPYVRKSFTDVKPTLANKGKSAPADGQGLANTKFQSRSSWMIPKEASEKEKVKQWLEKRGRSIASCRHVHCLGHKLEDFGSPQNKLSARKSIHFGAKKFEKKLEAASASPELKRQNATLNTTFEKEDDQIEEVKPISLELEQEDQAIAQPEREEPAFEDPSTTQGENAVSIVHQVEQPVEFGDSFEANGDVEILLRAILGMFEQPTFSETKIQSWLLRSKSTFPAVKAHAFYWEIKARLAESRGDSDGVLDIYSQAVEMKAEPLGLLDQYFKDFQRRFACNLPAGQATPLLKDFGFTTPQVISQRRQTCTPRRPLIDSSQIIASSVLKYELKLKRIFRNMQKGLDENDATATPMRKTKSEHLKTPMKIECHSTISVANKEGFQLVATPVRRSMRPKSLHPMDRVREDGVLYVDDLDELSPSTRSNVELRDNSAIKML